MAASPANFAAAGIGYSKPYKHGRISLTNEKVAPFGSVFEFTYSGDRLLDGLVRMPVNLQARFGR
jgi:hypothetical protein